MSDCLFCKIVEGSIPSKKIYENEFVYAFADIDPKAPFHAIVIPKQHIASALRCSGIAERGAVAWKPNAVDLFSKAVELQRLGKARRGKASAKRSTLE